MKIVSSREVYQCKLFHVSEAEAVDPKSGFRIKRAIVQHAGSAVMMPVDEKNRVLLVRQYRLPAGRNLWELPAGRLDPGEKPLQTAIREIREETGITAVPVTKLADIKYVYVRSWGDKERVFKIVSFYLLRYDSGRIDDIVNEMRVEVARAKWVRLEDAPKLLAYRGEKQMARKALEYIEAHPDLQPEP